MNSIKIGFAPTRRSIFSAPDAVKYRGLTADRLRELGVDFVDITDVNDEGLLYDEAGRIKIAEKFKKEKKMFWELQDCIHFYYVHGWKLELKKYYMRVPQLHLQKLKEIRFFQQER